MSTQDVSISNVSDWTTNFVAKELDTIVDPMVFRSADVFLRGRSGSELSLPGKDSNDIWKALSSNIGSLIAFFDTIILSKRLPIIDYGGTFDPRLGFDPYFLLNQCNEAAQDQLLVPVHVTSDAYLQAKLAALAALQQRPPAPPDLAASVLNEMSAFDYAWEPDLSGLDPAPQNEAELLLTRFLYGGLVFGAYAQATGVSHLLQPKRSRMYLAMSLGAATYEHENQLFEELGKIARRSADAAVFELTALPPFLPYLLSQKPRTPADLLRSALQLREDGPVKDYRSWRSGLIREWREESKIDLSKEKDIQRIVHAVAEELRVKADVPLDVKLTANINQLGIFGVGVSTSLSLPLARLWGWVLEQVPGRRYTKLLMRLHLESHQYRDLDRALQRLWTAV